MEKPFLVLLTTLLFFTACQAPVKEKEEVENESAPQSDDYITDQQMKAVEFASAAQYNNYIANRQMKAVEMILQFNKVFKINLKAATKLVDSAVLQFDISIRGVNSMPSWQGKTGSRDKSLLLLRYYKKAFKNDYKRFIAIMKDGSVSLTESAEIDRMIKTQNTSTEKLLADLRNEQTVFASENKIVIMKDEEQQVLQHKIDKAHGNQ